MLQNIAPPNLWPRRVVTATSYTLAPGDAVVYCRNTNNLTITLPSASTMPGIVCCIIKDANNAATVTIGSLAVLYIVGDAVWIQSDGTKWIILVDGRQPHLCTLTRAAAQTGIGSGAPAKVNYDTITKDNAGLADIAQSRVIIRRTGDYTVLCNVWIEAGGADLQIVDSYIFRGGSAFRVSRTPQRAGGAFNGFASITYKGPLTAGDIIEGYVTHVAGADKSTLTGAQAAFISIEEVR